MTNIYIFDFGNRIKIGKADDVKKRLRQIESSAGERTINQFSVKTIKETERIIHDSLKKYRTVGEYFNCSFEIAKNELVNIVGSESINITEEIDDKYSYLPTALQYYYELPPQERKIISYLISNIESGDNLDLYLYEFQIKEFYEVCEINETSNDDYITLKNIMHNLSSKSFEILLTDKEYLYTHWIGKVYMNPNNDIIKIRFDNDIKPYLLYIKETLISCPN